jgi:ribosomal protein L12E/L44/L45/RPP1/RPP2
LKEEMDRIRMRNMSLSDMRSVLKNIGMSSDWLSRPQLVRALAEAKIDGKISESMMFASDVGGQSGNRVSASTRMQTSSKMNSADGYTLASMRQNPRGSIRSQFRNDVSDAKARNMKANQITAELDRIKRRNLSLADMRTMLQEVGVSTEWLARPQLARALAEAKVDGIISEQRLQNSMNTMSQAEVENRRRAAAASTPIRNDVNLNADRGSGRSSFARRTIAENQARVQASRQSTQQQLQNRRVSTEGDSQRAEFNRFTSQRRRPQSTIDINGQRIVAATRPVQSNRQVQTNREFQTN